MDTKCFKLGLEWVELQEYQKHPTTKAAYTYKKLDRTNLSAK